MPATAWRPSSRPACSADVADVWEANGLNDQLKSAAASMTIDGKKWGVPYTYYQWGIYYNKDAYKKAGVEPSPKTWAEFVANCEKFKAAGIDCLTTGSKALWPGAGIFDYLNLRTNGYEFHMDLAAGKIRGPIPKREGRLRRMGQDPALHHREPCRHRLAGCRGAARRRARLPTTSWATSPSPSSRKAA